MGALLPDAPRLFDFQDYRAYLAAHFAYRKSCEPEFSLRAFARHPELKLSSSSFLSAVLKGRKNLGQALRLRLGRALGLKPAELEYFESLVQANQGKSAEDRAHYRARLARFQGSRARALSGSEYRFFACWWYAVVWHWIGLHPDQSNPARIAKSVRPQLEPAQAEEAIRALLDLKLIKKLANGYAVTERHLAAGPGPGAEAARAHAREFLRLAQDDLERPAAGDSEYHVLSFALPARGRERLREKLDALRAEARELAAEAGAAGPGERVYALAWQFFPCSEGDGAAEGAAAHPQARAGTSAELSLQGGPEAGPRAPEKIPWTDPSATP